MDNPLEYLSQRLKEPSTWTSLGILVTAIGWKAAPQYWDSIAMIGMGIGGILGAVLAERKKTTPAEIKAVVQAVAKPEAIKPVQPSEPELKAVMQKSNGT